MKIVWDLTPNVRCDIVAYAGTNLSGKRTQIQIFRGRVQGSVATEDLASMVFAAPHGSVMLLKTVTGPSWESYPWRAVRILRGKSLWTKKASDLPRVRIPHLDLLHSPDAKKVDLEREATFDAVNFFAEGKSWTFGRPDAPGIRNRVVEISIVSPLDSGVMPEPERPPFHEPSSLPEESSQEVPMESGPGWRSVDPIWVVGDGEDSLHELLEEALAKIEPGWRPVALKVRRKHSEGAYHLLLCSDVFDDAEKPWVLLLEKI